MEKEYSVKNKIFHTQDLCLRTNLRCAKNSAGMENIMAENQEKKNEEIREFGQIQMKNKISLLTIIGEIEGHDCLPATTKTTKYEHVLPKLAELEDNPDTEGLLLLLNTVGGDVESGLAIAEMIASIRKPTVSLVLGCSHSIGVPLAVSTDYSFIVPSGTMLIHLLVVFRNFICKTSYSLPHTVASRPDLFQQCGGETHRRLLCAETLRPQCRQ